MWIILHFPTLKSPFWPFPACRCVTPTTSFFHPLVVAGPRRYRVSPNPPPSAAPLVWQDPTELHPRLNANVAWRVNHGFPTTTTGKYENQITLKKYIKNKHHKKKTHTHTPKLETYDPKRQNVCFQSKLPGAQLQNRHMIESSSWLQYVTVLGILAGPYFVYLNVGYHFCLSAAFLG